MTSGLYGLGEYCYIRGILTYARSAMKRFIFFARVYTWLMVFSPLTLSAQDTLSIYPNYVVIGAFAHQKNAVQFTADAKQKNFPAKFEMNPNRNLFYVYVLTTDDREYAFAEALKLRTETKYWDTWVYSGGLGDMPAVAAGYGNQDLNPETRGRLVHVNSETNRRESNRTSGNEEPTKGTAGPPLRANASLDKRGTDLSGKPAAEPSEKWSASRNDSNASITKGALQLQGQQSADTQKPSAEIAQDRSGLSPRSSQQKIDETPKTGTVDETFPGVQDALQQGPQTTAQTAKQNPGNVNRATTAKDTGVQLGGSGEEAEERNGDRLVVTGPPPVRATTEPLTSEEIVGKNFYFHLFRADNHKMVPGEVDAIDFEKSRRMATYEANAPVKVIMPSGKAKQMSFVCQVFGYRKQQKEFDPNMPSEDLYLDDKGNLVMPFELVRLQKGDIAIMYNVFFFKDAAVMRPESRYEVNNLLDLLVENPAYNIRIHGHTNGNASGKIIRMNMPGNFYSLSGTKQGAGTAKQLSEERAIVIRDFLVSSGIAADRMEVKAWGGKKPIHDKHSVRASENVRVEIEILSD